MIKRLLRNLKTTLLGSITGLPVIASGLEHKDPVTIITGLGLFLTGLFAGDAKDSEELKEK
jgi:hypothetical protein